MMKGKEPELDFINAFEAARLHADLTQKQLSELSGVNVRQIRKLENGEMDPGNMTAKNFLALTYALNADPYRMLCSYHYKLP